MKAMKLVAMAGLALLMGIVAQPSMAGSAQHVTIKKLHLRRSIGQLLFIELSAPQSGPACTLQYNWHFVLPVSDEVGKKLYAALLAAYAAGSVVTMDGTGGCTDYTGIETMDGFVLEN